MVSTIFASCRTQFPTSVVTATPTSGGNTTIAHNFNFRVSARCRGGKNLDSNPIPVSVGAGQRLAITINTTARGDAEDIYSFIFSGETTGNAADAVILCEWEAKGSDQSTLNSLPATFYLSHNEHFILNGSVAASANLPSAVVNQTINGMVRFVTDVGKYYQFRSASWVEVTGASTYLLSTTDARTGTKIYGGCDRPVLLLSQSEILSPPNYDTSLGGDSYPLKYWLLNGLTEGAGVVVDETSQIDLDVLLGGNSSDGLKLAGAVTVQIGKKVRKSTGTGTSFGLTNELAVWENQNTLFLLGEDLEQGYGVELTVKFNYPYLGSGDTVAFNPTFKNGYGSYSPIAELTGDCVLSEGDKLRIVPGLPLRRLSGQVVIKPHNSDLVGATDFSLGLASDTDSQKASISALNQGQIVVYPPSSTLLSTQKVRAIVSTLAGTAPASNWSNAVTVSANGTLQLVVNYPSSIRSNYPDAIAGSNKGQFNVPRLLIELRKDSTTITRLSPVAVVAGTSQTITITTGGSAIASPTVNNSADFNLWGYGSLSLLSVAIAGSLTAGSYQVRIYYDYPTPNNQLTKISHSIALGCLPELNFSFTEVIAQYGFWREAVTTKAALKALDSNETVMGEVRLCLENKSLYYFNFTLPSADDNDNYLSSTDVPSRGWVKVSGGGGSGSGGHVILDNANTALAQQPDLKFGLPLKPTNDAANTRTLVSLGLGAGLEIDGDGNLEATATGATGENAYATLISGITIPASPNTVTGSFSPTGFLSVNAPAFLAGAGFLKVTGVTGDSVTLQNEGLATTGAVASGAKLSIAKAGLNGTNGTNGTNGVDGKHAFTVTTANFTVPAVGSSVTISTSNTGQNSNQGFSNGQYLFIQGAGTYEVLSVDSATQITAKNLYSDNVAAGSTVAIGSKISSSGKRGDTGPAGAGGRVILTSDRTYYVRTDGSNTNDGLVNTSGGAFASINKALETLNRLDGGGFDGYVRVAAGTYTANNQNLINVVYDFLGFKAIYIIGDETTPDNVVLSLTSSLSEPNILSVLFNNSSARIYFSGFKITATQSSGTGRVMGLYAKTSQAAIFFKNINFGSITNHHINSHQNALIESIGDYTVSGSAFAHMNIWDAGIIQNNNYTITFANNPTNFSYYLYCNGAGIAICDHTGNKYVNKSYVTGQRYLVELNGIGNGVSGTKLPGSSSGATTLGGEVV